MWPIYLANDFKRQNREYMYFVRECNRRPTHRVAVDVLLIFVLRAEKTELESRCLKQYPMVALFGVPYWLRTDNGPQFASEDFETVSPIVGC